MDKYVNSDGSISHILPSGMIWHEPPPPRELWRREVGEWPLPAASLQNQEHRKRNMRYLEEARRWLEGDNGQPSSHA